MLVETIGEIQSGKYNLDANSCKHLLHDSYAAIFQSVLDGLPGGTQIISMNSQDYKNGYFACRDATHIMLIAAIAELKEAA